MYGTLTDEAELDSCQASIRRTIRSLEAQGLVHRTFFRPDYYAGMGMLPIACWLSKDGEAYALKNFPETYPKSHARDRSYNTIPHDLRRTDTRVALFELAEKEGWEIGCRKSDLNHIVKPDDFYEITKTKTAHLFLEEEVYKKSFEELYEKLSPYVENHGSSEFKDAWGFRYFNVLIPMRDEAARANVLAHFSGGCNCIDPKLRKQHQNAPFKLKTEILWFTTHDEIVRNPAGKIFKTPASSTCSLLDIIQ